MSDRKRPLISTKRKRSWWPFGKREALIDLGVLEQAARQFHAFQEWPPDSEGYCALCDKLPAHPIHRER